jgi:hypothetical protein
VKRRDFITGLLTLAAAPLAITAFAPAQELSSISTIKGAKVSGQLDASTIRKIEAQLSGAKVMPHKSSPICRDITWPMRLRTMNAHMVARNIPPFADGLYRGNIAISIAERLFEEATHLPAHLLTSPKEGDEFEFAGFRLRVVEDSFAGGMCAWGVLA